VADRVRRGGLDHAQGLQEPDPCHAVTSLAGWQTRQSCDPMAIRTAAPNSNDVEERSRRSQDEDAGPRETSQKMLCTKIRTQAKELAVLTERLQEEAAYSRLVEKCLVELDPDHPLPVTPRHLGR
ncbi:unnamed protein product, partial [Ectocarpus sp. 12 AP-2014]